MAKEVFLLLFKQYSYTTILDILEFLTEKQLEFGLIFLVVFFSSLFLLFAKGLKFPWANLLNLNLGQSLF